MISIFLSFITSLTVTAILVPRVIGIAIRKNLFDSPTEPRKIHTRLIPNLGGIAIYAGMMFTQQLFIRPGMIPIINQVLMCGAILFFTGLEDDVAGCRPARKFAAQFAAAIILVIMADVRITNLRGTFEIYELSTVSGSILSIFIIVGMVNAYNLIDGVDGLAGCLGTIMSITFAYAFYITGQIGWCYLAVALAGAIVGFLWYNVHPARIFMGDSGSLLIGYFAAIMGIRLSHANPLNPANDTVQIMPPYSIILAVCIIPVFDTARVIIVRVITCSHLFNADRNHLHHRLLSAGMSHTQISVILSLITFTMVLLSAWIQQTRNDSLIWLLPLVVFLADISFTHYLKSKIPLLAAEDVGLKQLSF